MPTLKQINCSLELGPTNTKLKEYGHRYTDGGVEAFVAVPEADIPFHVHVASSGYIASGLAAYVYMDGQYQCNRNRQHLKVPRDGMDPREYEVDFRLLQKEEKTCDADFIAREWTFAQLKTANADKARHVNPHFAKNVGTIEVVILRCKEPTLRSLSAPQSGEIAPDSAPAPAKTQSAATSPSAKARSVRAPSAASEEGGLFGIFDGAADDLDGTFTRGLDGAWDEPGQRYTPNLFVKRAPQSDYRWDAHAGKYRQRPLEGRYGDERPRPYPEETHPGYQRLEALRPRSETIARRPPARSIHGRSDFAHIEEASRRIEELYEQGMDEAKRHANMDREAYEHRDDQDTFPGRLRALQRKVHDIRSINEEIWRVYQSIHACMEKMDDPSWHMARDWLQDRRLLPEVEIQLDQTPFVAPQRRPRSMPSQQQAGRSEVPGQWPNEERREDAEQKTERNPTGGRPRGGGRLAQRMEQRYAQQTPVRNNWGHQREELDMDGLPKTPTPSQRGGNNNDWRADTPQSQRQGNQASGGWGNEQAENNQGGDTWGNENVLDPGIQQDRWNVSKPQERASNNGNDWNSGGQGGDEWGNNNQGEENNDQGGGDSWGNGQDTSGDQNDNQNDGDGWPDQNDQANDGADAWGANDNWNEQGNDQNAGGGGAWGDSNQDQGNGGDADEWGNNNNNGAQEAGGDWGNDKQAQNNNKGGDTWGENNNAAKPPASKCWGGDGAQSHPSRPDSRATVDSQVLRPKIKPYWTSINHITNPSRPNLRDPYIYPPPPTIAAPSRKATPSVAHGIQAGRGATYTHKCYRPEYLDSFQSPYAIFTFKYRSRGAVETILGRSIDTSNVSRAVEEAEQWRLMHLPKDELVREVMRLGGGRGGGKGDGQSGGGSNDGGGGNVWGKAKTTSNDNNSWGHDKTAPDAWDNQKTPSNHHHHRGGGQPAGKQTPTYKSAAGGMANDVVKPSDSVSQQGGGRGGGGDDPAWQQLGSEQNANAWNGAAGGGGDGGGGGAWQEDKGSERTLEHFAGDAGVQQTGERGAKSAADWGNAAW